MLTHLAGPVPDVGSSCSMHKPAPQHIYVLICVCFCHAPSHHSAGFMAFRMHVDELVISRDGDTYPESAVF